MRRWIFRTVQGREWKALAVLFLGGGHLLKAPLQRGFALQQAAPFLSQRCGLGTETTQLRRGLHLRRGFTIRGLGMEFVELNLDLQD
jgi:hypothetical protein